MSSNACNIWNYDDLLLYRHSRQRCETKVPMFKNDPLKVFLYFNVLLRYISGKPDPQIIYFLSLIQFFYCSFRFKRYANFNTIYENMTNIFCSFAHSKKYLEYSCTTSIFIKIYEYRLTCLLFREHTYSRNIICCFLWFI